MGLGDDEIVDFEVMVVLGVGDRRFQALLDVDRDPLADLQFSRKRIAGDVKKCLESAIANAENNHDLDVDELIVSEAFVGNGMVMKRFAPRGRGRSGRIYKPFSQLTIIVRQVEAEASA